MAVPSSSLFGSPDQDPEAKIRDSQYDTRLLYFRSEISDAFTMLQSLKQILRPLHLLVIVSICSTACSSQKKFDQQVDSGRCEEALENIPENQAGPKLLTKAKSAGGTLFSYAAIGSAYTVEVAWDVVSGVTAVVVVCAPLTIAYTAAVVANADGRGSHVEPPSQLCLADPSDAIKAVQSPPLGREVQRSTANWDCPDFDPLSRSIRRVAGCFASRPGAENRQRALETLKSAQKSESFFRCLSSKEQDAFKSDLAGTEAPAPNAY